MGKIESTNAVLYLNIGDKTKLEGFSGDLHLNQVKLKNFRKVEEWLEKASNLKIRKFFFLNGADRVQ